MPLKLAYLNKKKKEDENEHEPFYNIAKEADRSWDRNKNKYPKITKDEYIKVFTQQFNLRHK